MADRILVLNDGNKIIEGTPEFVFEHEKELKECGLNLPQCAEIIHRMREKGIDLYGDCATVDECVELILNSLNKEK